MTDSTLTDLAAAVRARKRGARRAAMKSRT
jgi:hypothetical protein